MGERRGTKALETWCRRVTQGYPGVKVDNMTTSWRDGLAFCAMIHHFRPDLIDFSRLDKADIYGNNELAFRIAERHLGIPALLDAEDMAEYPVPDRLSILTYLSQFYQAFASNSSSPIKKATSDSPDGSLVSLVQGNVQQSTKMEEGSSLPRREPCVVCNFPVFIAQKLRIDGKLYHRTCFRCARCDTQLTLADYYETHDGQYCCETCPDEIIMDTTKIKQQPEELEVNVEEEQQQQEKLHQKDMDDEEQTVIYENKIKSLPPEPPPPPSTVVNKDPSKEITRPSASLVAIRRMMFDSYSKDTDDAKLIINKKDLSHNIDSSSHIIKSSSDKIIVNNNNINNNNISSNNDDINNKKSKNEDTHQFTEIIISKADNVKDTSNTVDNVNKQLDNNMYKKDIDKSLPLSKYSDTSEIDSVQVSGLNEESRQTLDEGGEEEELKEDVACNENVNDESLLNDTNKLIEKDSLTLHTENVINKKVVETSINEIEVEEIDHPETVRMEDEKDEATISVEEPTTSSSAPTIPRIRTTTVKSIEYPDDLNPFGDDDEEDQKVEVKKQSTNPFGSDSEDEEETIQTIKKQNQKEAAIHKSPSLNPFGSDDDDDARKPVPLPRKNVLSPEPVPFPRNKFRGSSRSINSLTSTFSLPSPRKKKPAPQPPISPCSTLSRSPRQRKAKRAPLPPTSSMQSLQSEASSPAKTLSEDISINDSESKIEENKSEIAKEISSIVGMISDMAASKEDEQIVSKQMVDEDKAVTVRTSEVISEKETVNTVERKEAVEEPKDTLVSSTPIEKKRLFGSFRRNSTHGDESLAIPLLIKEPASGPQSLNESIADVSSENVSFISDNSASLNTSFCESLSSPPSEKKNKDSANMHRKISEGGSSVYLSKSSHGQWRRKKAPAPPLPLTLPKRRPVQTMPMQNIKQELHDIEIKQQGLERQGVTLENKIRDKFDSESTITPYVEELVLQLFELVNEKNELFRKQAELMYLRRQHHLEEEHSELEYQIRCLMARPEANKTDSDKELEEQLIQRLVEVVERRDAIVQCLEMDRLREAEEDRSINAQLGIFTLAMAKEVKLTTKKKHKKSKDKQNVLKMMDLDKDVDDTEKDATKKKKKWYTLHHIKGKHL